MSLPKIKIQPDTLSPLDEVLLWVKTGVNNLFPDASEFIAKLTLDIPPPHIGSNYALSMFTISEVINQDPSHIATRLAERCSKVNLGLVKRVYAIGPYLNIEVDKRLYCQKVFDYIFNQGDLFGSYHQLNPESIYINYLGTNLRASLVGQTIGRHYEWTGHTVSHHEFDPDREELNSIAREVVADALEGEVAEYISNTNVVVTLTSDGSTPLILQKHDKSLTKNALHLAYQKNLMAKAQTSTLIYISPKEHEDLVKSLIANSKRLRYIPLEAKTSVILVEETNGDKFISEEYKSIQYAMLRVSPNKKAVLDQESLLVHSRLVNLIQPLQDQVEVAEVEAFSLAQLLVAFPLAVASVLSSDRPDHLCAYLEKVADLYEKLALNNKDLSKATAIVFQNGLRLLVS